ncbi:MAG TPA: glycosyl hydrolase family 8 [Chloroflexia bacterium]|nr:glycosyl hydrolase family 8 [Chloroflexia bacterium]
MRNLKKFWSRLSGRVRRSPLNYGLVALVIIMALIIAYLAGRSSGSPQASLPATTGAATSGVTTRPVTGAAVSSNRATTTAAAVTTTAVSTTSQAQTTQAQVQTTSAPPPTVTPNVPTPTTGDTASLKGQVSGLLYQLWQTYKNRYVQQDGRVRDPQRADASTSEGESYALLRALWQEDRGTFDSVLNWSLNNLQKPRGDKLFAYLWGRTSDNNWKVIDRNAATDADQDIAFALLLASRKWGDPRYQTLAQEIIGDIWNKTVVTVKGRPYLTAGDWAPALAHPVLNPSYFSPYEYRLFALIDPDKRHDWLALVDTSYEVIKGCTQNGLDASSGKLPPNWCAIDKQSGNLVSALDTDKSFDSDFGYDAFRTIWRVTLDYRWNGDKRALDYLQSLGVLRDYWKDQQKLAVIYDHTGKPKDNGEDLGIYAVNGVTLFQTLDPTLADQVVATKLLPRLQDTGRDDPDPAHIDASKARTYYAQNWTWFGLALYSGVLPSYSAAQFK